MAKIGQQKIPVWPWGGPRSVREKLVDPAQFERKRRKKVGDPKRPPLASAELLDFMGPGHASDDVRLPPPPSPYGDGARELTPFPDRSYTREVVARGDDENRMAMEAALARINAAPEKLERMRALLAREGQMLNLLEELQNDTDAIIEMMKREYKANGSY